MSVLRLLVAALVLLGLPAMAAADHHQTLMQEVEALGDKLEAAMTANDVDTMMAMYAEDAISLPNYGPRMDGVAAFRKHHEEMTAAGMKINSFTSEPTDVWACGDQVIEIGTYTISLDMPGMPGINDAGKYMTVYVRDADGALKIKAETWNTDTNPMEMMGGMGGHEHGDHGEDSDSDSDSDTDHDMDHGHAHGEDGGEG